MASLYYPVGLLLDIDFDNDNDKRVTSDNLLI